MYLSDRDISWAIEKGLLVAAVPEGAPALKIDPTSIDLHLDGVTEAKIWDIDSLMRQNSKSGLPEPELRIGTFSFAMFAEENLIEPPDYDSGDTSHRVCRRGPEILVRPGGFLLWQTKEEIGTPATNPNYICFIDGKSTRARTGILVHLTAPTIHAGWSGKVVLEIVNLGPFTFVLRENDVIAQLTVATISSPPEITHLQAGTSTAGQKHVGGSQSPPAAKPKAKNKKK